MIELKNKKKCWREKVTAEITLAHVLQFAQEMGSEMSAAELARSSTKTDWRKASGPT